MELREMINKKDEELKTLKYKQEVKLFLQVKFSLYS